MVVKKSALIKDAFRDIKNSLGRFLAIVSIVALGVAFFSGLKISPEDMKYTADKYYDDYNLMDIRIVSTLGLTEEDLEEINRVKGIKESFGTYTLDALTNYEDKEVVLRIHGFISNNQINGVNLIEGRLPEKPNECLAEIGHENITNIPIGTKINLYKNKNGSLEDDLENTEFEVVGTVQTPYYLSFEKGKSNLGNGKVGSFIMIPQENFKLDVYTDIYATIEGAKGLNSYKDEYFDVIDEVTKDLKELAKNRERIRYNELITEARKELEDGKKEYYEEKEKIEKELEDALKEIEDAKLEIQSGEQKLRDQERSFYANIEDGKRQIREAEIELENGEEEYSKALEEFQNQKSQAEEGFILAEGEIQKGEEAILMLQAQIEQLKLALENPQLSPEEIIKLQGQIQSLAGTLEETKESVEVGKKELASHKEAIKKGEEELNKTKEMLIVSRDRLEEEKRSLILGEKEGIQEINKARAELEQAKEDLAEGEKEYNEGKEEAERELTKAWDEILDGEQKIKEIEKAKWYILDRNSHYSYVDYGGAADRIDALAKVFPLFFAMVAALVSLTTMTRMVDEQRVNIGTLKALGYGKGDISFKYMIYALTATVLGCILGIAIGYTVFPIVIFNAYGMMYILPPIILRFNIPLALSISIVAIGLTTLTAYMACNNELKENAASLMRPKAPRIGKTIFLERIPAIWNNFNFSYKVTLRNIFRYKRRFFMTVFGIAGCTALVLTAFGVRDSIRGIIDAQYGSLFTYDISIGVEERGINQLEEIDELQSYQLLQREGGSISLGDIEKDISIVVPENAYDIGRFIHLQNPKNGKKINIPERGVVITEQVSKSLKAKIGDRILLTNSDDNEQSVEIVGITENYTLNYLYISPIYYQEIFQRELEYNEALGILKDDSKEMEDKLSRELLSRKGITSVEFTSSLSEDFEDIIDSLGYVVLVMIVSAGSLAFVVLYNLTNVNISERIREIATIKVLGFYDNEVSAYIYRENTILTIIGTLTGLLMGIFLHRYIMTTVEMDNIMFGLKLNPLSYIYSVVLTLGFSILVNFVMHYKLRDIKMVESLKSID